MFNEQVYILSNGQRLSCDDFLKNKKEYIRTTDLDKYSIQMPYLLFTPYHLT